MRIWDTFLFGGHGPTALDMLECRCRELEGLVYRHVVSEARLDYRGNPKQLYFADNASRFAQWPLMYVTSDHLPGGMWDREHAQREACDAIRPLLAVGDVIAHGDLDEIPTRDGLLSAADMRQPVVLVMRVHLFAADWLHKDTLPGTVVFPASALDGWQNARAGRVSAPRIFSAGWHLSWFGGPEGIEAKARTTAHPELDGPVVDANGRGLMWEHGWVPWEGEYQRPVEIDDTWPRWIAEGGCPDRWRRPRA